ncbi:MAG: SDR family oxidoreductase, partial [Pirellulaceae bacterium]|nr:SDR family oxidoreductase [Pirellulaceae bacterium]
MKVLVIGGAGYIGSAVIQLLWQQGYDVTVLDLLLFGGESLIPLMGKERFRLIHGDLRDERLLNQVVPQHDAVCLLAAIVGEPACNHDPENAVATNLDGARKVMNVAKAVGVERFVFASTCSNYGVSSQDELVTENAPLQPLSTYSETKVAAEQSLLEMTDAKFHPTVLRFSTAFGISSRMRFDLMVSDFTLAAVRDRRLV